MSRDHTTVNREHWNDMAEDWVALGVHLWEQSDPIWGIWECPEAQHRLLPKDMHGLKTIELGCGTGYVSGWMIRRGAEATAIDISANQLATARRLAAQHGAKITFLEANAEDTGLPDTSFDFAISEYGAAIWCDPHIWLAEAHRLLRPGGQLVFLGHHPFVYLCTPDDAPDCESILHRPYLGMKRQDWTTDANDPGGIEFCLTFSGWLDLFSETGFTVTRYQEIGAPDTATGSRFGISADWSRSFPCEQIWHLRKQG